MDICQIDHQKSWNSKKIYQLFQISYRKEAELIGIEDFPPLRRNTIDIQKSNSIFYGYYENNDLLGLVELEIESNRLQICSLVVDPNHFRKGIGSKLIQFGLETFQYDISTVETALANKPAILLYEKFGFVETKVWMTDHKVVKIRLKKIEQ